MGSGLDKGAVAFGCTCEAEVAFPLEKGNCLLGGSSISGDFVGAVLASSDFAVSDVFALAPIET